MLGFSKDLKAAEIKGISQAISDSHSIATTACLSLGARIISVRRLLRKARSRNSMVAKTTAPYGALFQRQLIPLKEQSWPIAPTWSKHSNSASNKMKTSKLVKSSCNCKILPLMTKISRRKSLLEDPHPCSGTISTKTKWQSRTAESTSRHRTA